VKADYEMFKDVAIVTFQNRASENERTGFDSAVYFGGTEAVVNAS
jgi:hypothetical protein